MGTLYKLTSPSGKSYIGITSQTTEKRWWKHKNNAKHGRCTRMGSECMALYDAIRKYGEDAFKVETLLIAEFDYLKDIEKKAIAAYSTKVPMGYNLTDGGDGALGASPTSEARKKMSAAQKSRLSDADQKEIILASIAKAQTVKYEKWWALSEEERIEKRKEHAKKLEAANRFTPEVRAKISAAQSSVGTPWSEERKAAALASGAYKFSDEKKRIYAEKKRQEWADPVIRQKRLDGFRKAREARKAIKNGS